MSIFKAYQQFGPTDVVLGSVTKVSSGFFPGGVAYFSQSSFVTNSGQSQITGSNGQFDVQNGLYYLTVNDSTVTLNELFNVTYGDFNAGGDLTQSIFLQTKAIYSQYKNLLLGTTETSGKFLFRTGSISGSNYVSSDHIYVVNFAYNLMKDQIDPGQFQIGLYSSGSTYTFVDDSGNLPTGQSQQSLVYEIVEGSFVNGQVSGSQTYKGLGLFYPKNGCIVFNADALSNFYGISFNSASSAAGYPQNHIGFLTALQNATTLMRVRKSEFVPSTHYFVRVMNRDFNFSNNPTFVYQSSTNGFNVGDIIQSFSDTPASYVTSVGLYNDLNELVAVAKLSQPTRKDFSNELLIRVRLDS